MVLEEMDTETTQALPETVEGRAVDGHVYVYQVRGTWPDGTLQTWSYNAVHSDQCNCNDPDSWY
jgi:hypothetical protein